MKKLLLIIGLLWSVVSNAQFTPGQILTAAELNSQFALYAPLTGASFTGPITATGITGTPINGSTGSFTNLSASGTVSFPSGTITPGNLASQAANTVLANVTASSASPTAVAIPSCGASTSALQYTSGTGFSCGTGFAALSGSTFTGGITLNYASAGVTINDTSGTNSARVNYQSSGVLRWDIGNAGFNSNTFTVDRYNSSGTYVDSPVMISPTTGVVTMFDGLTGTPISGSTGSFTTLAASSTVSGSGFTSLLAPYATLASPTFTGTVSVVALTASSTITPSQTAGIVGTTTNNNANAGSVGEYVTATGTGVSLTNNTPVNVTSISLTAGDWEVSGALTYIPAATTTVTSLANGFSTTTGTLPAAPNTGVLQFSAAVLTTGANQSVPLISQRFSLSTTTTVFLVGQAGFGVSTMTVTGIIRARRVR